MARYGLREGNPSKGLEVSYPSPPEESQAWRCNSNSLSLRGVGNLSNIRRYQAVTDHRTRFLSSLQSLPSPVVEPIDSGEQIPTNLCQVPIFRSLTPPHLKLRLSRNERCILPNPIERLTYINPTLARLPFWPRVNLISPSLLNQALGHCNAVVNLAASLTLPTPLAAARIANCELATRNDLLRLETFQQGPA